MQKSANRLAAARSNRSVRSASASCSIVFRAGRGLPSQLARAECENPRAPISIAFERFVKLAFDLESRQVEKLDLAPMVSITDHDNINAPMLLRTVPSARQIPVSVEWTAPYGNQSFHLGIHNLPSAKATSWMDTLAELHGQSRRCEADPDPARAARRAQCAGGLQSPLVGSLPHRQRKARVPGQRVPAEERQLPACAGAERPAQLGRESRGAAAGRELARALGVDWLMGGVHVEEGMRILAGTATRYLPFGGKPLGHPTRLAGSAAEIEAHCRAFAAIAAPASTSWNTVGAILRRRRAWAGEGR